MSISFCFLLIHMAGNSSSDFSDLHMTDERMIPFPHLYLECLTSFYWLLWIVGILVQNCFQISKILSFDWCQEEM